MNLKKAKKFAKEIGFKWLAVDEDNEVYSYPTKPKKYINFWSTINPNKANFLGKYTGKRKWSKTLRKVK